jgi:hypothetical protein
MRPISRWITTALLLALALPIGAAAQEDSFEVRLSRDFGYAAGGDIQGLFTMQVRAVDGVTQVSFLIDGEVAATDSEAPFEFQFSTGDFPLGVHTLSAVGTMTGGGEIRSPERTVGFVSADEGWKAALRIAGPVLVIVLLATILGVVGPLLLDRKGKGFRRGEYGIAGGAVCPRCRLPFSRHTMAPNLLLGKLERCPHCGKWSIVRQASRLELEAAEARFDADSQQGALQVDDERERVQREIEDSRFEP